MRDALRDHARAAMDVSDGFLGDLAKLLKLEGLTVTVAARDIPMSPAVEAAVRLEPRLREPALTGGDDYEIICAVAPHHAVSFERAAAAVGLAVACVGTAITGDGPIAIGGLDGALIETTRPSFQHFT